VTADAGGAVRLRAGDEDRRRVTDSLGAHHAEGRLDLEEFLERMEAASTARFLDELPPLLADLPSARPVPSSPAVRRRSSSWPFPAALVLLVLVLAAVAAATHGRPPVFPLVLILWWVFVRRSRQPRWR